MVLASRLVRSALLACLFLSGAAGLAFEVLWTRILGLSFGHTVYAVTAVLAAFMGGLALGSRLLGRLADRQDRPLLLYGSLEVGIALYCTAAPTILDAVRSLYLSLYPYLAGAPALKTWLQFSLSVLVLAPPAFLMGGTLPTVVRFLSKDGETTGRMTSLTYGINTLGAAVGALACGYWALPTMGIARTNLTAATLSLLAGSVAILLGLRLQRRNGCEPPHCAIRPDTTPDLLARTLFWGVALSGAAAMAFQVLWTRALILILGSSTYAFSCILVTFLAGLAVGSLVVGNLARPLGPRAFAILQVAVAGAAFLLIPTFESLPGLFLALFGRGGSHARVMVIQFVVAFTVVFPPTVAMGMALPCAAGILASRKDRVGTDVGRLFAWNTWGAVVGAVATGMALLPMLGVQKALALAIAANLLAAALVLGAAETVRRSVPALAWILAVLALFILPSWNRALMVSGPAVYPNGYYQTDKILGRQPAYRGWKVLFFEEGISSTVAVVENRGGVRSMKINGRTEVGSRSTDLESFVKLSFLPMALHPAPKRVAIIGLGAGITAYTAAAFEAPGRIDVLEIDPSVARAQKVFSPGELDALFDPRVHLAIEDGRTFLEAPGEPYDVIISGPSQTWAAGVANLFTLEFLEAARRRLAEGGILCLWMHGYFLERRELEMVFRTFQEVFPEATVWEGNQTDFFLIGRDGGWPEMNLEALAARMNEERRLSGFLNAQGDDPLEALLSSFRLSASETAAFAGSGPLNTDDRNLLEFEAPRGLYLPFPKYLSHEVQSLGASPFPPFLSIPEGEMAGLHLRLGRYALRHERPAEALSHFERVPPLSGVPSGALPGEEAIRRLTAGKSVIEGFDGTSVLPFYPLVGGYRPDGEDWARESEQPFWLAYREWFLRVSGPLAGAGPNGSGALRMIGPDIGMPVAFLFPIPVEPGGAYEVSFHMRVDGGPGVEAGAGYMEYRAIAPYDDRFTVSVHERSLVGGKRMVSSNGPSPWSRHSFVLAAGPETRMVHIQLYRLGEPDPRAVFFDDLRIRKVN